MVRKSFRLFVSVTMLLLLVSVMSCSGKPSGQGAAKASGPKVEMYAFNCGVLKTQTQYMLKDTRVGTPMDIPVIFFVIKHGNDYIAFDTGNNSMVATDPIGYWSQPVVDAYTPVMEDYQEFRVQLKKQLGIEPKDLKAVILSHGHLDHAGAINNLVGSDVPIILQKKEMAQIKLELAKYKETGVKTAYIPGDWDEMAKLNFQLVDGVVDYFDDGSVVLFPTPGHTPGHQSLMIKSDGDVFVMCADAGYTLENIVEAIPPGLAWDVPYSLQALRIFKVFRMSNPNVKIVPSHDPDYWKDQPLAPAVFKPTM